MARRCVRECCIESCALAGQRELGCLCAECWLVPVGEGRERSLH